MARTLTRRETIVALLETYRDALLQEGRDQEAHGDPHTDRLLLLSRLYHEGSYAELEDALRRLREHNDVVYWHLSERYLRTIRRTTSGCPHCRQPMREGQTHRHGRSKLKPARIVVETWDTRVDEQGMVNCGLAWLDRNMPRAIKLPPELAKLIAA